VKNGIITLGEALIDFIPVDSSNVTYLKNPGGAPANVAVGASRLGAKSTFIGKVGNDMFGKFLEQALNNYGVDTSSMKFSNDYRTAIVFVQLDNKGERSFTFYLNQTADQQLSEDEINSELFRDHKIFHFGTISLKDQPVKNATLKAIEYARNEKMILSFDPNVRLSLWDDHNELKEMIFQMLNHINVLKISEEELVFLTGDSDQSIIHHWMQKYNIDLVFLTAGENGSYVFTKSGKVKTEAIQILVEDTTGAGDGYVAGMLYQLNNYSKTLKEIQVEDALKIAKFASVTGGLAASKKGAMTALPTIDEVNKYLNRI